MGLVVTRAELGIRTHCATLRIRCHSGHMNTETTGQVPEWSLTDRLRKARALTGLDQDEFAELIGVSRGTVSSYEKGSETHKRPYLLAWAIGSGVSYEWLVTGRELAKT